MPSDTGRATVQQAGTDLAGDVALEAAPDLFLGSAQLPGGCQPLQCWGNHNQVLALCRTVRRWIVAVGVGVAALAAGAGGTAASLAGAAEAPTTATVVHASGDGGRYGR